MAEVQVASVEEDAMIGKMKARTNLKIIKEHYNFLMIDLMINAC